MPQKVDSFCDSVIFDQIFLWLDKCPDSEMIILIPDTF